MHSIELTNEELQELKNYLCSSKNQVAKKIGKSIADSYQAEALVYLQLISNDEFNEQVKNEANKFEKTKMFNQILKNANIPVTHQNEVLAEQIYSNVLEAFKNTEVFKRELNLQLSKKLKSSEYHEELAESVISEMKEKEEEKIAVEEDCKTKGAGFGELTIDELLEFLSSIPKNSRFSHHASSSENIIEELMKVKQEKKKVEMLNLKDARKAILEDFLRCKDINKIEIFSPDKILIANENCAKKANVSFSSMVDYENFIEEITGTLNFRPIGKEFNGIAYQTNFTTRRKIYGVGFVEIKVTTTYGKKGPTYCTLIRKIK